MDDFTREGLALVAHTSISGQRVVRERDTVIARRGRTAMVVSDNGTELNSRGMEQPDRHPVAPHNPRSEHLLVQAFIAEPADEALHEGVLGWLATRN